VRILDEHGQDCGPGGVGEIFLRWKGQTGPSFAYTGGAPARTTPDWFSSLGDLGWTDADGYLFIADRRVDMIVSGGANVYPAEVEAAMSDHPGVSDVVVVGLPDGVGRPGPRHRRAHRPGVAPGGRRPAPALPRPPGGLQGPKSFEVVDALPRTAAGKIRRSSLVAQRRAPTSPD